MSKSKKAMVALLLVAGSFLAVPNVMSEAILLQSTTPGPVTKVLITLILVVVMGYLVSESIQIVERIKPDSEQ